MQKAGRKQAARLPELDYLRVVSMFAVVMIHVTSGYILSPSGFTLGGMNAAFMLNQASRFAVPLFIMLSGASLTIKYGLEGSAEGFYRRGLPKILAPYAFWSCAFCLSRYGAGALVSGAVPLSVLVRGFLLGQFASQLYFIVVLTQCYLLYPALRKLVRRYPVKTLVVCFAITLALQFALGLQSTGIALPAFVRGYGWLSFPSWIFFFCLGLFANRERLERLMSAASKAFAPCAAASLIFAWGLARDSLLSGTYTSSLKPQIMFFTIFAAFTLTGLARRLDSASPRLSRAVAALSKLSFTVYFSHVMILNLAQTYASRFFPGTVGMTALYLTVAALSILFAAAVGAASRLFLRRPRSVY